MAQRAKCSASGRRKGESVAAPLWRYVFFAVATPAFGVTAAYGCSSEAPVAKWQQGTCPTCTSTSRPSPRPSTPVGNPLANEDAAFAVSLPATDAGLGGSSGDEGGGLTLPSSAQAMCSPKAPLAYDDVCSVTSTTPISLIVNNYCGAESLELFWVDYDCKEVDEGAVPPGQAVTYNSFVTHHFRLRDSKTGALVSQFTCGGDPTTISVVGN